MDSKESVARYIWSARFVQFWIWVEFAALTIPPAAAYLAGSWWFLLGWILFLGAWMAGDFHYQRRKAGRLVLIEAVEMGEEVDDFHRGFRDAFLAECVSHPWLVRELIKETENVVRQRLLRVAQRDRSLPTVSHDEETSTPTSQFN